MEISITVKQLGKKQSLLTEKGITINYLNDHIQLDELLKLIVEQQLALFKAKAVIKEDDGSIQAVSHNYMDVLMDTGKTGFGNIYGKNKIDLPAAQDKVLQAFEDGIFAVFQAEEQLDSLQQIINLKRNQPFTFIRLTFLAGSYW